MAKWRWRTDEVGGRREKKPGNHFTMSVSFVLSFFFQAAVVQAPLQIGVGICGCPRRGCEISPLHGLQVVYFRSTQTEYSELHRPLAQLTIPQAGDMTMVANPVFGVSGVIGSITSVLLY
jgi:hypothetical protein